VHISSGKILLIKVPQPYEADNILSSGECLISGKSAQWAYPDLSIEKFFLSFQLYIWEVFLPVVVLP
jgi:hypothetical protein